MVARPTLAFGSVFAALAVTAACGSAEDAPAPPDGSDTREAGADAAPPSVDGGAEGGGGDATPNDPAAGDLARAAIILASCHGGGGPFGGLAAEGQEPSELLYFMQTMLFDEPLNTKVRAQLACLGTKTSGCKALEECMGTTIDAQPCTNLSCDGTVSERCVGTTRRVRVDCARLGQRCEVGVGCVEESATPCGAAFTPSCNAQVELCSRGFTAHGPKCAVFSSLSCGTGNNGPACVGSGAACQGGVSSAGIALQVDGYFATNARCENDALVTCVGNKEAALGCNTVVEGLRCQTATFGNRTLFYCGRGAQCAPGEPRPQLGGRPTCDGDDYVICNGGIHERISCKALGFASCNRDRCEP